MTAQLALESKRNIQRLNRSPSHMWNLRVDEDKLITKNIANISPTGMSFRAPLRTEFQKGQILHFSITLTKDDSFECDGEIIWTKKIDDALGTMYQFGVRFHNVPAKTDATIMRAIHNESLRERRIHTNKVLKPMVQTVSTKMTIQSVILSVISFFVIAALTAAFLTAVYIHQTNHPEESIAYKFNHAMLNRNISSH